MMGTAFWHRFWAFGLRFLPAEVPVPVQLRRLVPLAEKRTRQVHVPQIELVDRHVDVVVPVRQAVPQVQRLQRRVDVPQVRLLRRLGLGLVA